MKNSATHLLLAARPIDKQKILVKIVNLEYLDIHKHVNVCRATLYVRKQATFAMFVSASVCVCTYASIVLGARNDCNKSNLLHEDQGSTQTSHRRKTDVGEHSAAAKPAVPQAALTIDTTHKGRAAAGAQTPQITRTTCVSI